MSVIGKNPERKNTRTLKNKSVLTTTMKGVDKVIMKTRRMKVVLLEQGKPPQLKTVGAELRELQRLFAAGVKVCYPSSDSVALIFDKSKNVTSKDGEKIVLVTGKVIICGTSENRFCSLTPAQQEKYLQQFSVPED